MHYEPQRVTRPSHHLRSPVSVNPDRVFSIGGRLGPTAVLNVSEKRKASCACRESKHDSLVIQPVALSLYIDRVIQPVALSLYIDRVIQPVALSLYIDRVIQPVTLSLYIDRVIPAPNICCFFL